MNDFHPLRRPPPRINHLLPWPHPVLILTPSQPIATASEQGSVAAAMFHWVRSPDGQQVVAHGSSKPGDLPADSATVLVLPMRWVSWQRVSSWPKLSGNRLRSALDGMLEDRLLQDTEALHFALPAQLRAGEPTWVACCDRQALKACLDTLTQAGHTPERIVPAVWPSAAAQAVVRVSASDGDAPWVSVSTPEHCAGWPLHTSDAMPSWFGLEALQTHWSADAASVARAETALGVRCAIESPDTWLLRAAAGPWNLAQFEFSQSAGRRRQQRWHDLWRTLRHDPAWRPARWGLVALLLVQLAALNLHAYSLNQQLQQLQGRQRQVLQTQFPEVTLVVDPVLQMQRELDRLRQASGEVRADDLEALLATLGQRAATEGWPGLTGLEHNAEATRLTANGLASTQLLAWQQWLAEQGLNVQAEDQSLVVRP